MEDQIRQQLDDAMPDIIKALKLKVDMLEREIATARVFDDGSNGNRLHIVNCREELDKAQSLLTKLTK